MYQFYYADKSRKSNIVFPKDSIENHFIISAVRPAMWEEHCLECSAPACFDSCVHYLPRSDGRCKRFENGILTYDCNEAIGGKAAHVKFRKWGNMMTIIFPAMLSEKQYDKLSRKNEKLGNFLKCIEKSFLPRALRWQIIRTAEYLRRRSLRKLKGMSNDADAFVFHAFSYFSDSFNLIVEIYDDHTPVWKTAINVKGGENIAVITDLSSECSKVGNLVKVYPENNIEAELDIYWCDFVKGSPISAEKPSDKVKCVVWDLDNTLWDGILIETEDTSKLNLREGVLKTVTELDNRGIIQSIASKNDYEPVMSVLNELGVAEYFLYPQISWGAKSSAVKEIAKRLNIGIDTFALIDDSPFERAEVATMLPQVRTYTENEIPDILNKREFDVPVTKESKCRRLMYKAEEKRNAVLSEEKIDILDFLKKIDISIEVFTPESEEDILRCYELISRTNQLNMTGNKYGFEEFKRIISQVEYKNFAFSCKDKFGEYGIVGFGQYTKCDDIIHFTEFAMSCRVAGKYVESALFHSLLNRENCMSGKIEVIKTKKNILLRNTLENIGFKVLDENSAEVTYSFTAELKNCDTVNVTGCL